MFGPAQAEPRPLPFAEHSQELPMVLSLEGRRPEVGKAGAGICRQTPHLACFDFLATLGEERQWCAGRHCLDSAKALTIVLEYLQSTCPRAEGIGLAIPGYLRRSQAALLNQLATDAKLRLSGSIASPLANALAAHSLRPWIGPALVLDVDDHALTASVVMAEDSQLQIQNSRTWPHLSFRRWKGRILDAIADRCVRQSRRDPRDSALAEQSLYEQIDHGVERARRGEFVEVFIQTAHWYQNLNLRPEEFIRFAGPLVKQTIEQLRLFLPCTSAGINLRQVCLTDAAQRLPGLAEALDQLNPPRADVVTDELSADFGENLLQVDDEASSLVLLPPGAAARNAHRLAVRIERRELPAGHFELAISLPKSDTDVLTDTVKGNLRVLSPDS
jgi:hypothetical protein